MDIHDMLVTAVLLALGIWFGILGAWAAVLGVCVALPIWFILLWIERRAS